MRKVETAESETIRIETIETFQGFRDHRHLQDMVWGYENSDSIPTHLMVASSHLGGVVLGAYAGDTMVGCLFGVPALRQGRLLHLSHLLGVHPGWRAQGIGERMKWRQRELVLQQGIALITWTYDPLEAPNARLNLAHLGGRVSTYRRDYYGPMEDALNRGLPSDRFVVDWQINAPWVRDRLTEGPAVPDIDGITSVLAVRAGAGSELEPGSFSPPSGDDTVLVPIPVNMQVIRRLDRHLALSWRLATREAFEQLFAAGYVTTSIVRRDAIAYYYLERRAGTEAGPPSPT